MVLLVAVYLCAGWNHSFFHSASGYFFHIGNPAVFRSLHFNPDCGNQDAGVGGSGSGISLSCVYCLFYFWYTAALHGNFRPVSGKNIFRDKKTADLSCAGKEIGE